MRTALPEDVPPCRFGVIGAGAMGISLAAMLGHRHHMALVVRDRQRAERLRRNGVRVVGLMNASSRPCIVESIARLVEAAPLDAVFVATKTTAIDAVAGELRPILDTLGGPHRQPFVISFQNGIEPGRSLMQRLQYPKVLRMVLNYGATKTDENTSEVVLSTPPHFLGGPDDTHHAAAAALAAVLSESGLPTEPVDNIEPAVWMKGLLNAAMNPVAALTNSSIGDVLDSPARAIVARLLDEGLAVAAAESIELGSQIRDRMWSILDRARPHTPSMVSDIRHDRPSEVGQLNRQILAHAVRLNVPVPSHEVIAAMIDAFDWRVFQRVAAREQASGGAAAMPANTPARVHPGVMT